MPREIIEIHIIRKMSTSDGAGGYTQSEAPIAGSPFDGRLFRRSELKNGDFVTDTAGETNRDDGLVASLLNPKACVKIDDLVVILGSEKARIVRVRRYTRSVQCDLLVGVD